MSIDDSSSIEPIKLAQNFIRIVDFNADPLTVYSASSGTVSYDSIISPKKRGFDAAQLKNAFHQARQPPRPHHVSKICKLPDVPKLEKVTPVDLDMFREIKKEEIRRSTEIGLTRKVAADWMVVNYELLETLDELFDNLKKPKEQQKVLTFTVEFEAKQEKVTDFQIYKRTISPSLASEIRRKHGEHLHGLQIAEIACRIVKLMDKNE